MPVNKTPFNSLEHPGGEDSFYMNSPADDFLHQPSDQTNQNPGYPPYEDPWAQPPIDPLPASSPPSQTAAAPARKPAPTRETGLAQMTRIFNTALIATHASAAEDLSKDLHQLMKSPPFRAILLAADRLAHEQGISQREAAETVIQTFRKMDRIWSDYVFLEGIEKLKHPRPQG